MADTLSDDEVNQIGFADEPGSTQQSSQGNGQDLSDDEVNQIGFADEAPPPPSSSGVGAFARQAIRGIVPTVSGAAAGLEAAGIGAGAGALVAGPVGAVVGGIGGALVGAGAGASVATSAQDAVLNKLAGDNPDELGGVASDTQEQADIQQHPYWSAFGQLAPAVLSFNLSGAEGAMAKLANAGIMGGVNVAQQYQEKGTVDPAEAAISAGAGYLLGSEREGLTPFKTSGERIGARISGQRSQVETGATTGRPNVQDTPDAAADRAEADDANDITAVAIGATNDNVAETNTAVTPTVTDPAATIAVTRNADDYAKSGPQKAPADGVPGAASTPIQTDGGISSDIASALATPAEAAEAAPAANGTAAPAPEPAPDTAGLQTPQQPAGAGNNLPTLHGVPMDVPPHVADILNVPQVKNAIENGAVKNDIHVPGIAGATAGDDGTTNVDRSLPKIAVLPSGNRFEPAKALQIHEQVEKFVQSYLTSQGMNETSAFRVAHHDFAEPAEQAYYKGLGIDPAEAQKWFERQGKNIEQSKDQTVPEGLLPKPDFDEDGATPHEHYTTDNTPKPTPEEQAAASMLLRKPPEAPPKEAETSVRPEPTAASDEAAPAPARSSVEPAAPRPPEVDKAVAALRAKGMHDRADALEAMEPVKQFKGAIQINKQIKNAATRQTIGDVQVSSSKDGARKQGSLDATEAAFEKFPPKEGESPGDTLTRAKAMVDHAKSLYNGADPIKVVKDADGKIVSGYKPKDQPAGWQGVKAAQDLLKKPNQVAKFLKAESELRLGMAKLRQETTRLKAERELNPRPETADVEGARQAETQGNATRVDFPDVPQKTGSAIEEDRQSLHDYINGLSDGDYRTLENAYGSKTDPFERVVTSSTDPHKLQLMLESELDKSGPGNLDTVNAMDAGLPVTKRERVTAGAPLKPSEEIKSKTFKQRPDLVAEYDARAKAGEFGKGLSAEETEAAKQEANKPETIAQRASRLFSDESGAVHLPSWLSPQRGNPASPNAAASTKEVADTLGKNFTKYNNRLTTAETKIRLLTNKLDGYKFSRPDIETMWTAIENKTWGNLPPKMLDAVQNVFIPMRDMLKDTMDNLRIEAPHLELPPDFAGVETAFLSRLREGMQSFDRPNADIDPIQSKMRTLGEEGGPVEPRKEFELTDGAGTRKVMQYDKTSNELTIFNKGAPQIIKNIPKGFDGELGDTIRLKIKGVESTFTVDHARAQAIEDNVKTLVNPADPNSGVQPIKYIKDPFLTTANAYLKANTILENTRLLEDMKSPNSVLGKSVLDNSTDDYQTAKDRGYVLDGTILPQMQKINDKTRYYSPLLSYTFDDFAHRGFHSASLDGLRSASRDLLKVMYTVGPLIHAFNETSLWAVGRGLDWMRPGLYKDMAQGLLDGFKSVATQDKDPTTGMPDPNGPQARINRAGGTMMLPSVLNSDLMRGMAERHGYNVMAKPSILNSLSKSFGFDAGKWGDNLYKQSSKMMMFVQDGLKTARVLELEKRGMPTEDAVAEAEKFISDYHIGPTVLKSRALAQFFGDAAFSSFGPYHIGILNSMGHILNKAYNGNAMQKAEAVGHIGAAMAMALMVYPALDGLAQWATGDDTARVGRRGFDTIPDLINQVAHGEQTGKDASSLVPYLFSPSLPMSTLAGALHNRDWTGKQIIPTNNYNPATSEGRSNLGQGAVAGVDYAGKNLLTPYNTISSAVQKKDATPGSAMLDFLASLFGVSTKSEAAQAFLRKEPKNIRSQQKARFKRPPGMLESLYDKIVGR